MELTKTDRAILHSYQTMLDGLGEYLGTGYEIVLHSLENYDHAAIKVINGHYTGRKEGAPITDLAVRMLSEIKKSGSGHKNMVYFNQNDRGTPMRSATLPIIGEKGRIIGLLCINFHMEVPLHEFLKGLIQTEEKDERASIVETYSRNSDDLILSAVEMARLEVLNNAEISAVNRNKEIVALINQKGIFQLKDSVVKVAKTLGITKNTVYLHLRKLSGTVEEDEG